MDEFFERFALRAATIDELLSDAFEALPGQKVDADLAARRIAAWCRSCASGDWSLFSRRLAKDGLSFDQILPRLSTVRRNPFTPLPVWVSDAEWIEAALKRPANDQTIGWLRQTGDPQAFEHLLIPIVESARELLCAGLPDGVAGHLTDTAIASLCQALVQRLSDLSAPALYSCFISFTPADGSRVSSNQIGHPTDVAPTRYNQFVTEMRVGGFRRLFESKPVLLRLIASVTRQWIESTREFIIRLDLDLPKIREQLLCKSHEGLVSHVAGGLGDLHNSGRSVQLVCFTDETRILYKPKDMRLEAMWGNLVGQMNANGSPIDLRTPRVVTGDGYGWSEFIDHTECSDTGGFERFFCRAGAWLCLFHTFAGTDMHEENMIAAGDHPVPIDLETILQATEDGDNTTIAERNAFELASRKIADSVIITGLLPAYGRSPENTIFGHGGLHNPQNLTPERYWENINTDSMKPVESWKNETDFKNIPTFDGKQAHLGDFIDALVAGYEAYANFLLRYRATTGNELFDGFSGLPARRLLKPTRFYALLLERLKDHRNMADGAEWSAHVDFVTRLMDWDRPSDPWWPLMRAERAALIELNIPLFLSSTDTNEIADTFGIFTHTEDIPGLRRAQVRFENFDSDDIKWQCEVIRLSTSTVFRSDSSHAVPPEQILSPDMRPSSAPDPAVFSERATEIAHHLSRLAIRSGSGAAWIGLDWLKDSTVCQLAPLGADLYNGAPGVCVFLAAHAKLTGDESSASLAIAGMSALRHDLRGVNAARFARALGLGGSSGLGSVVYAFSLLSELLNNDDLLADAKNAASLFTRDLIAADKSFDVMEGSAGAILGLLKLYRLTGDSDVLERAEKCGDHLLSQRRSGQIGGENVWLGWGVGRQLNGMSHGAAGFAYALTSLAAATGRDEFEYAARECVEFENTSFSFSRDNWPDFRRADVETDDFWPSQWCHGAGGIGLARIGTLLRRHGSGEHNSTHKSMSDGFVQPREDPSEELLRNDIRRAVDCVEKAWPYPFDTLCCGNLGNIELLNEAARCFIGQERPGLSNEASRRMMAIIMAADARGDYLWDVGDRRFNLGLFRGLAGVGYTLLRLQDQDLPNVLIWG